MSDEPPMATQASAPVADSASTANGTNSTAIPFTSQESIMAYSGLYLMALFCIYFGARRSVRFVRDSILEHKPIENSITSKEARMFPFTASGVLFGLYLFFKVGEGKQFVIGFIHNTTGLLGTFLKNETDLMLDAGVKNATGLSALLEHMPAINKANLMFLLLVLICVEGSMALSQLLKPVVTKALSRLPISGEPRTNLSYHFNFTRTENPASKKKVDSLMELQFDTHDIVSLCLFSTVGFAHVAYRHWITNDIIGLAFSLYGIEMLHLASFKDGCLLLSGLFVYDIFWVFATDVMTTVATGINAPILLMFPQDMLRVGVVNAVKHSMLGLGDIVIPGAVFLGLEFYNLC